MDSTSIGGSQSPPELEAMAFQAIVSSYQKPLKVLPPRFVKRTDKSFEGNIPPIASRNKAITLVERGVISQFTGIWPTPKAMATWLHNNSKVLMKRN
jgi:hypothetical protein